MSTARNPPSQSSSDTLSHISENNRPSTIDNNIASSKSTADSNTQLYLCSTITDPLNLHDNNEFTKNRPKSLHCCDTSHGFHKTSHKSFYVCSMLEESTTSSTTSTSSSSTNKDCDVPRNQCESRRFHCCSEYKQIVNSPIPERIEASAESYMRYSEQCTFCSFKIKTPNKSDVVAANMQDKRCCLKTITKHHRWKRKWNCCSNVPDSPDVPIDVIRTVSDSIASNTSMSGGGGGSGDHQQQHLEHQHTLTNGANNTTQQQSIAPISTYSSSRLKDMKRTNASTTHPPLSPNFKTGRPRLVRPWPVVRFRHMLRMIGRYRRPPQCRHNAASAVIKQNQVRPLSSSEQPNNYNNAQLYTSSNDSSKQNASAMTLPALPPPSRRKMRNPTDLQELTDSLTFLQQQQHPRYLPNIRRQRRKNVLRNRSPTLSPIHESGLSNPTSPQPCRHASCTISIPSNVCGTQIYKHMSP